MDGMGIGRWTNEWTHVWSDALHPGDEHDVEEAGDGEGGARKRREGVYPTYRDRDHKFVPLHVKYAVDTENERQKSFDSSEAHI